MQGWHIPLLLVATLSTQLVSAQFGGEPSNANPFVDTVRKSFENVPCKLTSCVISADWSSGECK